MSKFTLASTFIATILCFSFRLNAQDRCSTQLDLNWIQNNDPSLYQRIHDLENLTTAYANSQNLNNSRLINDNGLIIIPVVVHVLYNSSAQNISDDQIISQIAVLNEDYRRLNTDRGNTPGDFLSRATDYSIEFRLACIDPNGNPTNGVVRKYTTAQSFMYSELPSRIAKDETIGIKSGPNGDAPWPTDRYLNIWVCNLTGVVGYATWPVNFLDRPQYDGVVITTSAFGRVGNVSAPVGLGRTTTHEIGHWLNLKHLKDGPNCNDDDLVNDTPKEQWVHTIINCPTYPELIGRCDLSDPSTMFMNFMEWVPDDCMNLFTNGQRMRSRTVFATVNGVSGPRVAQLNNFFAVQQPSATVDCATRIKLFNPCCLTPTWSIVSGPASINNGQNTNEIALQISGNGTVVLRATAGNYVSDVSISVTTNIPNLTISGYPTVCNNRSNYYSVDLPPASSVVWSSSPSGKVNLAPAGPNGVVAIPINSPTGSYTLTGTISGSCTSAATLVVTFNTAPPAYTCSDVGNGTCTEYVPLCTSTYYDGRGFSVPNSFLVVPYWHWTVYGGKFSDGTTDAIISWNVPGLFVKPDFPTSSCNISIKPMNDCFVEDAYPPFQYIMINTGQNCYGSYIMSPNPASSDVTISTIQSTETKADRSITAVNIYSQEGNLKKQKKFGKVRSASISVSDLVNGIYVVEIISGDYKEQKQLVVQH